MEPKVHIGCSKLAGKLARYGARLDALEVEQTFFQVPRDTTLRGLRGQVPAGFAFIVKASQLITHPTTSPGYRRHHLPLQAPAQQYGSFQDTAPVAEATARTLQAAAQLDAAALLFETPADFRPTATNRARMARFFEALDRGGRLMAWQPRGLWSAGEQQSLARDLDLLPCWDPLATQSFPDGEVAYLRLQGLGQPRPVDTATLIWLAEGLAAYRRAFCIFDTSAMLKDAVGLKELLAA